jgi:hypothetical protein
MLNRFCIRMHLCLLAIRLFQSERCEMPSPLAGAKREVEDEVGFEGVRDAAERCEPRLVLPSFAPSDRRL